MADAVIQRFGIALILFGGLLHVTGAIQNNYIGLSRYGMPIAIFGVLLSFIVLIPVGDSPLDDE